MGFLGSATLAASLFGFMKGLFVTLFILSCILLILVVLVQKGRGGGLSSAFGGAMGSSPFGTKTGDVFTWITVVLAGLFLAVALVLNGTRLYKPRRAETGVVAPAPVQQPASVPAGPGKELVPPKPLAEAPPTTTQPGK